MDTQRIEELEKKRFDVGLTHEEANELGRLLAERAGKPYGNAESRGHPDMPTAEREEKPYSEPEVRQARGVDPSSEEPDPSRPRGETAY
ncbi:MAG TPA: hypothetical protein VHH54_06835 [Actinomycetota bacterium]|jgi:hypothetical protein|nr:hypothetical protein [Actinomycetota bacterium]